MVEQINFPALGKLSMPSMEGEEVRSCGSVQYYDKAFDRVVPKNERPLKRTQRVFRSVTTSDDPIIRYAPSTYDSCVQLTRPDLLLMRRHLMLRCKSMQVMYYWNMQSKVHAWDMWQVLMNAYA